MLRWIFKMSLYVPLPLFFGLCLVLLVLMLLSFKLNGISGIITALLATFLSFYNSQIIINGQVIQNIGGIDDSGAIIQGVTVIQVPALTYVFMFIGLVMAALTIYHVYLEFQFKKKSGDVELDF